MLKKLAILAVFAAATVVMPLGAASPALADGPANANEAKVCRDLLAWATPVGFTPTSVDAVCTIKGNHN